MYFRLIVLVALAVSASALPAKKDEVEVIPPRRTSYYGDQPIIDTGDFSDEVGSYDLFSQLNGLMRRMREQMEGLIKNFGGKDSNSTGPNVPFGGPLLPLEPPFKLGDGNTTSVTKYIDGHKVVINETEYSKTGDFGGSYFKVRIVNVQPDETTTEENSANPSTPKDVEPLVPKKEAEPVTHRDTENEISKSGEASDKLKIIENLHEDSDSVDSHFLKPEIKPIDLTNDIDLNNYALFSNKEMDKDAEFITEFNPVKSNLEILEDTGSGEVDLSRDTYINEIAKKRGVTINPDAEIFEVPRTKYYSYPEYVTKMEKYRYPKYDLSRDTYINTLAEERGVLPDPDTEYIMVPLVKNTRNVHYIPIKLDNEIMKSKKYEKFIDPR